MKKLSLILTALFILLIILFFIPDLGFSQPPPPPVKPSQTPIEGGLGLLAAAGGAYAIKKLRGRKAN